MQAHERFFDLIADEPQRSLGYPLCDAGWRDTLERLCIRIETALQENEAFEFVRIKQKFGLPLMKALPGARTADLAVLSDYATVAARILFDARAAERYFRRSKATCQPADS